MALFILHSNFMFTHSRNLTRYVSSAQVCNPSILSYSTKASFPTFSPVATDSSNLIPVDKTEIKLHEHNASIDKLLRKIKWSPTDLTAGPSFNRLLLLPAATLNHLCLGSIFAWSVFNQPLMRNNGVVAPSAEDWLLSDITLTFSLVMGGFAWGAVFSKYLDRLGPRFCGTVGSLSLFSGFTLASLAVYNHSLPLLYLGGLVWGMSNGWSYVPPVACLLKWFPERKGLASGLCLLGYGGGAMVAAPLFISTLEHFKRVPEFLGSVNNVNLVNQGGKLFAEVNDELREVVVATQHDIVSSGFEALAHPGVYIVGTGATGVAETFAVLGSGYGLIMALCSFTFKLPRQDRIPDQSSRASDNVVDNKGVSVLKAELAEENLKIEDNANSKTKQSLSIHNVSMDVALKTPQFWLLYFGFMSSITGAYGLLSCGKLILAETFSTMPLVTNSFTTSFVSAMSLANLTGRIGYTSLSDILARKVDGDPFYGRRRTFTMMFCISGPSYLAIIYSIHQGNDLSSQLAASSVVPLTVFCTSILLILSSFGGTAATRPALVADLYGLKDLAPLCAVQLSAVLPAAFMGPKLVTTLREQAEVAAINDLIVKVGEEKIRSSFGIHESVRASADGFSILVKEMVDQKSITIARLMEIVPEGTADPSPYMYDSSMYVLGGLQLVALTANLLVKPIPSKFHIQSKGEDKL